MGRILIGCGSDVLARGMEAGVALAIWRRELPPAPRDWLASVPPPRLPRGRMLVNRADIARALCRLFVQSGSGIDGAAAWLFDDLVALADDMCRILVMPAVDIRLDAVAGDACWKFHRDRVPARLVTTYRGSGTEWVHPRNAETALREQRGYRGDLHSLRAGDIALFKGSLAGDGEGIVHRSPPIAGSGRTRLLCTMDPPGAASPDLWRAD